MTRYDHPHAPLRMHPHAPLRMHLPDDVIETARTLYNQTENGRWALGDYLIEVVDELAYTYATTPTQDTPVSPRSGRAAIIRELADHIGGI